VPSFVFIYVFAVLIFALGQWTQANYYNLEPPLVALLLGLLISNVIGLPRWMDAGFRVEFGTCRHFRNDSAFLEIAIPGLSSLSSGSMTASVCATIVTSGLGDAARISYTV
jgi:hypothetical protein